MSFRRQRGQRNARGGKRRSAAQRKLRVERFSGVGRGLGIEPLEIRALLSASSPASLSSTLLTAVPPNLIAATSSTAPATGLAAQRVGALGKVGVSLADLYLQYAAALQTSPGSGQAAVVSSVLASYSELDVSGNLVGVQFTQAGTGDFISFLSELEGYGVSPTGVSTTYQVVDAFVPVPQLLALAELPDVLNMNPIVKPEIRGTYNPGVGGPVEKANQLSTQYGLTGAGVQVGILSDSANEFDGTTLATAVADGLLPNNVQILQDGTPGDSDEGAAMLEEVHAVAPGASLSFASADGGQTAFADDITLLANNGAKVIADDVGYADEPYFEPSVMDDAIQTAVTSGDMYFSAAGNSGFGGFRLSSNWALNADGNYYFNWDAGSANPAMSMNFNATVAGGTLLGLEWDNPWNGATGTVIDNVQLAIFDYTSGTFLNTTNPFDGSTGGQQNNFITNEPFQSVVLPDDGEYAITAYIPNNGTGLLHPNSPLPTTLEFVLGNSADISAFQYPGAEVSSYGHSTGQFTIGVGAVDSQKPTVSESFSSAGPGVYLFNSAGTRLAQPLTVQNPFVSAADDVFADVQFPDFDPFFGTSAAAPNAAAAAALMRQGIPTLTQAEFKTAVQATATPINGDVPGSYDPQVGYGLLNALTAYHALLPALGVTGNGQAISDGETTPISANDTYFGSAVAGSTTIFETFTITNNGTADPLSLQSVTVAPAPLSAITGFSISSPPVTTILNPGQSTTFTVEFNPTAAGAASAIVSIASNDGANPSPFTFEIGATSVGPQPSLQVLGNSQIIAYGENSPGAANDTFFGSTYAPGGQLFETYTITNIGVQQPLMIQSVSVTTTVPSASNFFSVFTPIGSSTLNPGQTTTFTIEFAPTAVGTAYGVVYITSNDTTSPIPFNFEISGTAVKASAVMQVTGNSQTINYGESSPSAANATAFGPSLDNGSTVSETYTIVNNGTNGPLNIQSVSVTPAASSPLGGFTVSSPPASNTLAPGQTTTFTIQFAPTAPGNFVAEVSIVSSDSTHPIPFVFEVSGQGVNPPPVVVSQVDDSNATGFSTTGAWSTYTAGTDGSEHYATAGNGSAQADYTFTGLTPGQYVVLATWAPQSNATSNAPFTFYDGATPIGGAVVKQNLAPNGAVVAGWQVIDTVTDISGTLRVALSNNAGGSVLADSVEIARLPGVTIPFPQLSVSGNQMAIASNESPQVTSGADFGSTVTGFGSVIHTFTLTNTGLEILNLSASSLTAVGSAFHVISQPSGPLNPGDTATFQVKFTPTSVGLQTGVITIATNDPTNGGIFQLFMQGTGAAPQNIDDSQAGFATVGTWTKLATGFDAGDRTAPAGTGSSTATWSFTGLAAGQYEVFATWPAGSNLASNAPFTLYNGTTSVGTVSVSEKLAPSGATLSGANFQLLGTVTVTGTSLKVTLTNKANGTVAADAIAIVPISATTPQAAQLGVAGNGLSIAASTAPQTANGTDFGSAILTVGSVIRTFTIANTGGTTLNLTGPTPLAIAGTSFTLLAQPPILSLDPGASETYQVKFTPTATGLQTGSVTIASNDPAHPSYKILLQGTGVAAAPHIAVSDNAVAVLAGGTPEAANGTDFGTAAVTTGNVTHTFTITNTGNVALTLTGATPVTISGASSFTVLSQPALTTLAVGASTTFQVAFAPTLAGQQAATVSVASNDPASTSFKFAVQGTGVIAAGSGTPTILDNGQSGMSLVGSWPTFKAGYNGNELYAGGGTGSLQANYTFTNLRPGSYQVYATWSSFTAPGKPASNTPFTLYNGGQVVGTVLVNQQVPPAGASLKNAAFQLLGTVNLTSSLLRVSLNNNANGLVLADAIAIVPMGAASPAVPQIAVSGGAYGIGPSEAATTLNGTSFGTAASGSTVIRSFTITNAGSSTLTLSGASPVSVVGAGFVVLSQPTLTTLAPGASITFQIEFHPTSSGVDNATVTIASNDPLLPSFSFLVQGTGK